MGIPSDMRDFWVSRRQSAFVIASPAEDRRISNTRNCTQEGVQAGFKAACVACVLTTVPTIWPFRGFNDLFFFNGMEVSGCYKKLVIVRKVPWAKANLNYTAQALIISAASIAAYFITADKTILECARKNSQEALRERNA